MPDLEKPYTEGDWKLFRKRLPGWQEAYMGRLNAQYVELLNGDGPASEKFWELEKRIRHDRKRPGVICEMKRSNLVLSLAGLLRDGVIGLDDLDGFSEPLVTRLKLILDIDALSGA